MGSEVGSRSWIEEFYVPESSVAGDASAGVSLLDLHQVRDL